MDKDPRTIIESLGVQILEIPSIYDTALLYQVYREAFTLAQNGKPNLIYPIGIRSMPRKPVNLKSFGQLYGIAAETKAFAKQHGVTLNTKIWVPGSLMSYRDVQSMLECLFLVNDLPGGAGHHDGHMKGRDLHAVIANPMLQLTKAEESALERIRAKPKKTVMTRARAPAGKSNLRIAKDVIAGIPLPGVGKSVSPRAGVEAGYAAVAKTYPKNVFVVGCDLDTSTKLTKARSYLDDDHQFEMSIEEQAAALLTNGLSLASGHPQLNVFSTFAAFFEGIAREAMEMWRYQRNLNGINEGLNVTFHLSHVGACTGRDHFSGWGLDWITLAIGYLPYLHRFYAPCDARSAFIAVIDLAAHSGGHIIGIPRDSLPILEKQDGSGPLWEATSKWEEITPFRSFKNAQKAILAFGAPAYLAGEAATELSKNGQPTDAYIVNGLPIPERQLKMLLARYGNGIVTVEDGIIGTPVIGLRGFAGLISSAARNDNIPTEHIGIVDPRIAASDGHIETWNHFGITRESIMEAAAAL